MNRAFHKQRDIVMAATSWLDTPYHHHARIKGVGVDCAQFVLAIAREVDLITDIEVEEAPNYSPQWHLHNREEKLLAVLESFGCVEIPKENTQPGDIICFKFGRLSSHLGIKISEHEFIHARYDVGRVVINTLGQDWIDKWTKTYAFPGIING